MGTVGLDFGTPTSGAGFNVSQTVSEIVANLQNVETPWRNQLTSLHSQDAAISNLGSLYSNLSNDMSQLTDFSGILAQKTGSSSNTNVLELTAASSTATAGTHSVTVNSLATTSSGFTGELSNASAVLTGAITLQVGNGTAETFVIGDEPNSPPSNTTYTGSADNTLVGLASAINGSSIGITANVESDSSGSWLSLTSATSGAGGNLTVSSNSVAATGQDLIYSGTAGVDASGLISATTSTGVLTGVGSSDTLTGSLSIQVGAGSPISVSMSAVSAATGGATIEDLATYLQNNYSAQLTAQTTTNSNGTVSLSLTSGTAGSAGTLTVNSSLTDSSSSTLAYTAAVTGADANLTIDGRSNILSSSNTVSNLIPGLTFQLLSASSTPVQVVIGNDNSGVESAVNQFVSDYNSLVSAMNTQEGNDSSGNPEPLFGSPTLSLLQQQLLGSLNEQNPNGYLTSISSTAGTTLSGSLSIQTGSGVSEQIVIGAGTSGSGVIYTGAGNNTLAAVAAAINSADATLGVTAAVVTNNGQSSLTLTSQTVGTQGALTVNSALTSSTPAALTFSDPNGFTSTTPDSGTLGTAGESDTLSGSLTIQTGSANPVTLSMAQVASAEGGATLANLASYIQSNSSALGVSALTVTNSDGSISVALTSNVNGSAGALTITSGLFDTGNPTVAAVNYSASSDINSLTSLGISVNNDGSLTFDANSLDALLNTDYSGVASFFQSANSWGATFSNMLANAGSSSSTGMLALAQNANSTIESSLNANISKEDSLISAQQKSLTAELNSANEILEQLPSQLSGINEIYSAITGFNQSPNG
jgi:flagellar hook-associated protein 2